MIWKQTNNLLISVFGNFQHKHDDILGLFPFLHLIRYLYICINVYTLDCRTVVVYVYTCIQIPNEMQNHETNYKLVCISQDNIFQELLSIRNMKNMIWTQLDIIKY